MEMAVLGLGEIAEAIGSRSLAAPSPWCKKKNDRKCWPCDAPLKMSWGLRVTPNNFAFAVLDSACKAG